MAFLVILKTRGDKMKETKKKTITMEQKIYVALLGVGVTALAALTILYGVQRKKTGDLVEQNIELGQEDPVSGQVEATETEEKNVVELEQEAFESEETGSQKIQATKDGYDGTEELSWPVEGNILIPYSMDTTVYFETLDQYQCNPALMIKANVGTEVKAVWGGTVTSVAKSDRYGQTITVDMGNGYVATYGQLTDLTYKKGDTVTQGETIGKVAEPTNYFLLEGSHLYMKMEKDKQPVNPTDYFTS